MTKKKAKEWECKQHFSKGLVYRLALARCCLLSHNEIRDNANVLINLENMKNLMM
jgi:hypothetical protein